MFLTLILKRCQMSNLEEEYIKIVEYVDCSQTLAECIQKDIKLGDKYSSETVVALSHFISATRNVSNFLGLVEQNRTKIN